MDLKTLIEASTAKMRRDDDKSKWLWRYMDLPKFINMITNKTLYFANARLFEDPREGYTNDSFNVRLAQITSDHSKTPFVDPNDSQRKFRNFLAVSCWTQLPVESVALWKMYTTGTSGVCIRTNIDILLEQLAPNKIPDLIHKRVSYEHIKETDQLSAFFRKTHEWAFESEYRLAINMTNPKNKSLFSKEIGKIKKRSLPDYKIPTSFDQMTGITIPVDLNTLIQEVKIHYNGTDWALHDMRALIEKFIGRGPRVNHSSLNDSGHL